MADNPITQVTALQAGQTEYTNVTIPVSGAAIPVLLNDPTRLTALLVNISGDSIFVGNDPQVSLNQGIELVPSGGFLKLARWEDYDYCGAKFFAISTGTASPLQVVYVTAVNTLL